MRDSNLHGKLIALLALVSVITIMAPMGCRDSKNSSKNIEASLAAATPSLPPTNKDLKRGYNLYFANCERCHHYDGQGDGPDGMDFIPHPANLTAIRNTPTMIASIVGRGMTGTAMPAFSIGGGDVNRIMKYVRSQPLDTAGTYEWDYPWDVVGDQPMPPDTARNLYITTCSGCHGINGDGNGLGLKDKHFWPKPANFHARNADVGRLYFIISNGIAGTMMAPQEPKIQTAEARLALARYVAGLYDGGAKIRIPSGGIAYHNNPTSPYHSATQLAGEKLFDLYCIACHGGEANGTFLAPKLTDRHWRYGGGTDNAVFWVVTNGIPGKLMPGHTQFTEQERWDVISYLRYRGGWPDPLMREYRRSGSNTPPFARNQ